MKSDQYQVGDTLVCLNSKSNAYTSGYKYAVIKDKAGVVGLCGNDGIFDPLGQLMSSFALSPVRTLQIASK